MRGVCVVRFFALNKAKVSNQQGSPYTQRLVKCPPRRENSSYRKSLREPSCVSVVPAATCL